jgi:tetratricopeptide (TPR) repeat protein
LYAILQKLEKGERLEPTDVAWLEENRTEARQPTYSYYGWQEEPRSQGYRLFSGKIFITYHKIEATFYEQEYKRTGNKWNLPNASSHWRKADRPKQALKLTENLNFDKIKENKLKSAILTTRGGAFRDIGDLDKAEKCARQAIEYQPNSHHPYTLMGAICFERGEYSEGEYWFAEAIKRGASPRDQDAEIKRVVKNAKDENKRREVVEYLLKKDPQRYAWAKSYLKKPQNKGK